MKIEPSSIDPQIWSAVRDGKEAYHFLVCGNRILRGPETNDPYTLTENCKIAANPAWVKHPVAIMFGTPVAVCYGFYPEEVFHATRTPEFLGVSKRSAAAALAEAYRDITEMSLSFPDQRSINLKWKAPWRITLDDCEKEQERTMLRNVNACLRWQFWSTEKKSNLQRAEMMTEDGFPCTETEVRKIGEKWGL